MRIALLFLSLCQFQCALRSPNSQSQNSQSVQAQNAAEVKFCGESNKVWDASTQTCMDPKTYCLLLKDGSVWDNATARCLSQLAQCQLRGNGSVWMNHACLSPQQACAANQQIWQNGTCVSNLAACQSRSKYWTLSAQGICVLKSFDEICQNRLSDNASNYTLSALQTLSKTTSCAELSQWLGKQTEISLRSSDGSINITDLGPFVGLTGLINLQVDNNSISDLTPLMNLSSLQVLDLENNKNVSDLYPLTDLTQLRELDLGNNQVEDLTPLTQLTNLRILDLWQNLVSEISPLANLTQLVELQLRNNAIQNAAPLQNLMNLQSLSLDYNPIANPSNRTATNCPSGDAVSTALRTFCSGSGAPYLQN